MCRDTTLFAPWVYSVARNVARDAWRKRNDARAEALEDRDLEADTPSPERQAAETGEARPGAGGARGAARADACLLPLARPGGAAVR